MRGVRLAGILLALTGFGVVHAAPSPPPLRVTLKVLAPDPTSELTEIAVLATPTFDPADIVLSSIRVNGQPIARYPGGELAHLRDVDGDGRVDLVVAVRGILLAATRVKFRAVTRQGRTVTGETVVDDPDPTGAPYARLRSTRTVGG